MADDPTSPTPPKPSDWQEACVRLLNAYDEAYREITDMIAAMNPAQKAFEQATELSNRLGEELRARIAEAATFRAQMVSRIWREEELSLAHLADKIGVSKGRADQMTRAAKAAKARKD